MKWWRNEEWDRPTFTWDLWYGCNYKCSYCWWEMDDLWGELAKRHRILAPERWLELWRPVFERFGEVRLDVLGGEPLRYPGGLELFSGLARWHRLSITTNLSSSEEELARLCGLVTPERLHLSASFHPQYSELGPFAAKVRLLQERGFEPHVTLVAWPPFFDRIPAWRRSFRDMGVPFTVQVFQGRFEAKEYPAAYTPEQRALLESTIPTEAEVEYRLRRRRTLGLPCGAGHVYANVKADGQVFRCGQDAFGRKPLGNLFDGTLELHPEPRPCPYEHCSCGEYYFLWENWTAEPGRGRAKEREAA